MFFSVPGETYVGGNYEERDPGNTKVAATILADILGCPMEEIVPETKYPREYRGQVERAKKEWTESSRPALSVCPSVSGYEEVYLCYPNWCGTIPMAVATFLESACWEGKIIRPLCTNEGSGLGSSVGLIEKCAPDAVLAEGLSVRGADVSRCRSLLEKWVS